MLPGLLEEFNTTGKLSEAMPWLAALVCSSAFDIALLMPMDAFTAYRYTKPTMRFMNQDLSTIQGPGFGYRVDEIDRTLPPAGAI